jgi:creatinine amidohydrolase
MIQNWEALYEVKGPKSIMEMTAPELKEAMKETDIVILSFSAIENHAAHLPIGSDYFQALMLIRSVYEGLLDLGIKSVPGFAIPLGVDTNHFERDDLFGNVPLHQSTFIAVVKDLVLGLKKNGFNKFVLCMNHCENNAALHVAAKDLAEDHGIESVVADWVPPMNDFWPTVCVNAEHQGHGGEDETSCVMAVVPNLVDLSDVGYYHETEDENPIACDDLSYYGGAMGIYVPVAEDKSKGYIGDPGDATVESGEICYDKYAAWTADIVCKYWGGK